MNPLIQALLSGLGGAGMYGGSPNVGVGGSPLLMLILHHLVQSAQQQQSPVPQPGQAASTGSPGVGNDLAGGLRHIFPITRRPEPSGTPSLQGFRGGMSSRFNPNEGGFAGPGMSEMTHPGMASGLYGSRGFGLGPLS